MKTVIMPPDAPTLMWSTRAIGYTTSAAVADLIDNSISAHASQVHIQFVSGENSFISILDDGDGMSADTLRQAMKYGSGNPWQERSATDLGRFGLGLKTASLSQCQRLTVASKRDSVISAYCWDLEHVIESKSWELLELDEDEIAKLPQIEQLQSLSEGTIVLWSKLDKIFAGNEDKDHALLLKIREVEDHLALTFHRYLQGEAGLKKLSITSNGVVLKPIDPFYVAKSDEMPTERIAVHYTNQKGEETDDNVLVTPFILPFSDTLSQTELDALGGKDGLIKNQGFYIYRNKRLIVAANWFRLTRKTDLTKLCRVRVDIPNTLDDIWTIDVKKSMAIPPDVVVKNLKRIIAPIIKAGKRKYKFRATKERSSEKVQLWVPQETRDGVIYTINPEYPILKDLMGEVQSKKKMQTFLRLLEQNIPLNTIHTDFYDDKKFAAEDVTAAYLNIITNMRDLLCDLAPTERKAEFDDLMNIVPFSEYDIKFEDLGDF